MNVKAENPRKPCGDQARSTTTLSALTPAPNPPTSLTQTQVGRPEHAALRTKVGRRVTASERRGNHL